MRLRNPLAALTVTAVLLACGARTAPGDWYDADQNDGGPYDVASPGAETEPPPCSDCDSSRPPPSDASEDTFVVEEDGPLDASSESDAVAMVDVAMPEYALSFNGNEFVLVPDRPTLRPAELTLEAWASFSGTPGFVNAIIAKPVGEGTADSYAIWYQAGQLLAGVDQTSPVGALSYNWTPDASWHYFAFAYSSGAGMQTLYLDGVAVASGPAGGSVQYDGHPVYIAADSDNGNWTNFFQGTVADVAIWSTTRSASQIATDMLLRSGAPEPDLSAYWSFDEDAGQVAHDASGQGNDGQLGSTPTVDAFDPTWVLSTLPP